MLERDITPAALFLLVAAAGMLGCSDTIEPGSCAEDGRQFDGGVCLVLGAAGAFEPHRSVIEQEVGRTLGAVRQALPVTNLRIVFLPDRSRIIPEVGIGGYNPSAGEVRIYLEPSDAELESIVRNELLRILSHEIHHAVRRRSVGYGSSLFQAAVTEGLADHFSLEVGGGDPAPWSVALSPEDLAVWMPRVLSGTQPGYDHGQWFLGTSDSIPRWTGYAVGFELVRRYLEKHPGASAAGLVDQPADAFRPDAN